MPKLFPRIAETTLLESLADSPATLIHGPRQCGKTTLARLVGDNRGYQYVSFDNEAVRAAAVSDPIGFVARLPEKTILDEAQYVPSLFPALKQEIDARRTPGRFLRQLRRIAGTSLSHRPPSALERQPTEPAGQDSKVAHRRHRHRMRRARLHARFAGAGPNAAGAVSGNLRPSRAKAASRSATMARILLPLSG